MRYRIAIDVGGTFTDLVYAGDGLASSRRPPPLRTRRRVYSSRQHRHQRLVANALATVNATFAGRPQQELENLPEKQDTPPPAARYVRCYIWWEVERETGIEPV